MGSTENDRKRKVWAVIPAAGAGSRMQADRPKQYLEIGGEYVLSHTLRRLISHPRIDGVMVVISPQDAWWHDWQPDLPKLLGIAAGGDERANSVLNGLHALRAHGAGDDWVMVHDAARPCVRHEDITRLLDEVTDLRSGGILALPISDTVKQSADGRIAATVPRERLWRAQTPQLFGLGALTDALEKALIDDYVVTDEASAMEHAGFAPKLVAGHSDNIKITVPGDLALAAFIMRQQERDQREMTE